MSSVRVAKTDRRRTLPQWRRDRQRSGVAARYRAALLAALVTSSVAFVAPSCIVPSVASARDRTSCPEDLGPKCLDDITRVLAANLALLDARDADFCLRIPAVEERSACIARVAAIAHPTPGKPIEIIEVRDLPEAGQQWPGAAAKRASRFQKIDIELPIEKADRRVDKDLSLIRFRSKRPDGAEETCLFPMNHWYWSDVDLRDRFAQAPRGICGDRTLSVTQYLLEQPPPASDLWAISFLSETEAEAWQSKDPERIKHVGAWNQGHEYAKFFLLGSLRWWRGGRQVDQPHPDYTHAVRLPGLPLERVLALERNGDAYLDIFEDGREIELTTVTRRGLDALLATDPEVLADRSTAGESTPRLEPIGR